MALTQAEGGFRSAGSVLGAGVLALFAATASAEDAPTVVSPPASQASTSAEAIDPSLSPECRVPGSKLYTLAKLKALKQALKEKRPIRVLSIGSSSGGVGASMSYPVKLETSLERSLPDVDVQIESRGLPGEVARGAAETLRTMIAEVEPDLVIWQVGTNDALARVEADTFGEALDEAVKYVKSHDIDVVLIDPLYTQSMAEDESYNSIVHKVQDVAAREGVPLVRRYDAMRFLAAIKEKGETHMLGRQFRLNDLGLRCMAEHVARAITLSLLQSDPGATGTVVPPRPQSAAPDRPAPPSAPN